MLEDAATHKVKRIQVNPGGRLSLQYHHKRAEVWTIVSGIGTITIDDEIKDYIHADKLHYLSREGLCRAVSDIAPNDLCFACFNGDYSVEVPAEQEEGVKYVLE